MEEDEGMVTRRKTNKIIHLSKNLMGTTEEGGCLRGTGEEEHHKCEEHRQCKDHRPLMELEADTVEAQDQEEDIQMVAPLEGEADHLWTEDLTLTQHVSWRGLNHDAITNKK